MPEFIVAIASDLHCYSNADPNRAHRASPSHHCCETMGDLATTNPVRDLLGLIESEKLRADLLLCPGDLGDLASDSGVNSAWGSLRQIQSALSCPHLLAAPGNHDLRHIQFPHDPDGLLRQLEDYPVADSQARLEFWTDRFCIVRPKDSVRVVILNSCAHHTNANEREFGRVEKYTLDKLDKSLSSSPRALIQILLVHHHPHCHAELGLGEADVIKNGQAVLDCLSRHGQWLVVHGHKHHPRVTHAAGNNLAPWVLAAGSLAMKPNPQTDGDCAKQFYLLHFDTDSFSTIGWGASGRAWDWAEGFAWRPASNRSGIPSTFGFGYLGDLGLLAAEIKKTLPPPPVFAAWADVQRQHPQLSRLSPRDLLGLQSFDIALNVDEIGRPFEIARSASL